MYYIHDVGWYNKDHNKAANSLHDCSARELHLGSQLGEEETEFKAASILSSSFLESVFSISNE